MSKPPVQFTVYEVDELGNWWELGRTWAVSSEKAINNVRFRFWGETSVNDLGIQFMAEPVVEIVSKPSPRLVVVRRPRDRQLVWVKMLHRNPVF